MRSLKNSFGRKIRDSRIKLRLFLLIHSDTISDNYWTLNVQNFRLFSLDELDEEKTIRELMSETNPY